MIKCYSPRDIYVPVPKEKSSCWEENWHPSFRRNPKWLLLIEWSEIQWKFLVFIEDGITKPGIIRNFNYFSISLILLNEYRKFNKKHFFILFHTTISPTSIRKLIFYIKRVTRWRKKLKRIGFFIILLLINWAKKTKVKQCVIQLDEIFWIIFYSHSYDKSLSFVYKSCSLIFVICVFFIYGFL